MFADRGVVVSGVLVCGMVVTAWVTSGGPVVTAASGAATTLADLAIR